MYCTRMYSVLRRSISYGVVEKSIARGTHDTRANPTPQSRAFESLRVSQGEGKGLPVTEVLNATGAKEETIRFHYGRTGKEKH